MHYLVHLICGSTGAGKTTYARQLAERIGAVRFSIDEWMTTLFWMDTPNPLRAAWSMERVERCYSQIWTVASQVAARRVPCVLDLGFTQANSRARFVGLAGEADFPGEEQQEGRGLSASIRRHTRDVRLRRNLVGATDSGRDGHL
jgi:predicted kinase